MKVLTLILILLSMTIYADQAVPDTTTTIAGVEISANCNKDLQAKIEEIKTNIPDLTQRERLAELHTKQALNRIAYSLAHVAQAIQFMKGEGNVTSEAITLVSSSSVETEDDLKLFNDLFMLLYEENQPDAQFDATATPELLYKLLHEYGTNDNAIAQRKQIDGHEFAPSLAIREGDKFVLQQLMNSADSQGIDGFAILIDQLKNLRENNGLSNNLALIKQGIIDTDLVLKSDDLRASAIKISAYVKGELEDYIATNNCSEEEGAAILSNYHKAITCVSCEDFAQILNPSDQTILGDIFSELLSSQTSQKIEFGNLNYLPEVTDLTITDCDKIKDTYKNDDVLPKLFEKSLTTTEFEIHKTTSPTFEERIRSGNIKGTLNGQSFNSNDPAALLIACEIIDSAEYVQHILTCFDIDQINPLHNLSIQTPYNYPPYEVQETLVKAIMPNPYVGKQLRFDDKDTNTPSEISDWNSIISKCIDMDKPCNKIMKIQIGTVAGTNNPITISSITTASTTAELNVFFSKQDDDIFFGTGLTKDTVVVVCEWRDEASTEVDDPCADYKKEFDEMLSGLKESEKQPYLKNKCQSELKGMMKSITVCKAEDIGKCPDEKCDLFQKFFKKNYASTEDDEVYTEEECSDAKNNMKDEYECEDDDESADCSSKVKTCDFSCKKSSNDTKAAERKIYTGEKMPDYLQQTLMKQAPPKAGRKRIRGPQNN